MTAWVIRNIASRRLLAVGCLLTAGMPLFSQAVRINEINAISESMASYGIAPGAAWNSPGFDDAEWGITVLPIGMDSVSDYELPLNLYDEVYFKARSVYARSRLKLDAALADSSSQVVLSVDYDDAFILYINGIEVARSNIGLPGDTTDYLDLADGTHRASNDNGDGVDHTETFVLGIASSIFETGINTLSVQLHNDSLTSSDLYLDLELRIGGDLVTDPIAEWRYFVGQTRPDGAEPYPNVESDWIELYNPSEETVSLEGWALTDDPEVPDKWTFPPTEIQPGGYLLVMASGGEITRSIPWEQATFKLTSAGEYLGLLDAAGRIVSEFEPQYPEQYPGSSYGWEPNSESYQILAEPSPGWANTDVVYSGKVKDTKFSVDRGFYDAPFAVEITSETEGSSIRYTTDGSMPTADNGILYTGPIDIFTTTVLRAIAYKEGFVPTDIDTHSYIFVDDVIVQGNSPKGYPSTWKSNEGKDDLPADYEMDPEVTQDTHYANLMRPALLSLPTISLVTEVDNLFDRDTGIYQNPQQGGSLWERPVSMEILYPNGREAYQVDCGVRIQGGHTRDPEKMPKHSLRLAFRKEYGNPEMEHRLFSEPDATETFDTIILRAGGNQSWLHHNGYRGDNRARAQYVRDQFAKNMQGRMGWAYLHNNYAYLYINGIFWGLYNPTERATNYFGESYLGGEEDEFDAINSNAVIDGDGDLWYLLLSIVQKNLAIPANYNRVAELLDLEQFTDYMLLNHWGGNEDWGGGNWYALGNRVDGKFGFYTWDSEFFFEAAESNTVLKNSDNKPTGIFHSLLENREYRLLVADRIHKHFYNGGMLTTEAALEEWNELSAQVYQALIAESARWGDYRRDVHRRTGPYLLYTRDDQWVLERQRLLNEVIPARNAMTLRQYDNLSQPLFPNSPVPLFSQEGGAVSANEPLELYAPDERGAVLYYTTDGTDPRLPGGDVSPQAIVYSEPIHITERTTIRARVDDWSGWSVLHEGDFHPAGDPADLRISEILYDPLPDGETRGKDLEFVEIYNAGAVPVPLDGLQFTDGIEFAFPDGQILQPGDHAVVVSNLDAFMTLNPGIRIAGVFSGCLANEGECLTLEHATLGIIQQVVYSNGHPWPAEAADYGHSLVPLYFHKMPQPTHSTAWRASYLPGGSPGQADTPQPGWIDHEIYGWVYSETGQTGPGNWLWGAIGLFYAGPEDEFGAWTYVPK